jgi:hypothetical protein
VPGPSFPALQSLESERGGQSYSLHLGTVDIPFACGTWSNPLRARRYDFILEVEVAGVQDVERAVADCLKQAAIVTALAALLNPLTWSAAISLFTGLMRACLATKLKNILRVDLQTPSHCL